MELGYEPPQITLDDLSRENLLLKELLYRFGARFDENDYEKIAERVWPPPAGVSLAPWTPKQVAALKRYQAMGTSQQYVCGDSQHWDCPLVPTAAGFSCPICYILRDWAYTWTFDEGILDAISRLETASDEETVDD